VPLDIQLMNVERVKGVGLRLILVLTYITMYLVEDFNVNALIDELVSIVFNEENPNLMKRL